MKKSRLYQVSVLTVVMLSSTVLAASPSFLNKGDVFYEDIGMSFASYRGTKVKLTVIKIDKKSDWVLFERSFGDNKELIWMNTKQMKHLIIQGQLN